MNCTVHHSQIMLYRELFILKAHKAEIQTSLVSHHASSRSCLTPCPHIRSVHLQLKDPQRFVSVRCKHSHIMPDGLRRHPSVLLVWVSTAARHQERPVPPSCAPGRSLVPIRLSARDSGWQIKCFTCPLGQLIWRSGFSWCFYEKKRIVSAGEAETACFTHIIYCESFTIESYC